MYTELSLDHKILKDILSKKAVKPALRRKLTDYIVKTREMNLLRTCQIVDTATRPQYKLDRQLARVYSSPMESWTEAYQVQLEFIKPGKPTQNSFVEHFNRTYRTEILDRYAFKNLHEVRRSSRPVRMLTENWMREYNEERPHDSLNDLTPWECIF